MNHAIRPTTVADRVQFVAAEYVTLIAANEANSGLSHVSLEKYELVDDNYYRISSTYRPQCIEDVWFSALYQVTTIPN